LRPRRANILDLDAQRPAQGFRDIDVESLERQRGFVQKGEWQIVAGHADAQRPTLDDRLQPRGLLRLRRGCDQEDSSGNVKDDARHQNSPVSA
jgi:hypothetical protein